MPNDTTEEPVSSRYGSYSEKFGAGDYWGENSVVPWNQAGQDYKLGVLRFLEAQVDI